MVAADFNGDGRIDLATAAADGVSILLGNGDGTFQAAKPCSLGFSPIAIVAGYFSDNGILDLAAIGTPESGQGGELAILMGNGDGTFQPAVIYPVGDDPESILAGNFAGNGKLDLAFTFDSDPSTASFGENNTVSVMLGNGDGTFQPPVNYEVAPASAAIAAISSLVAEDFTGDGKLDLLASTLVETNGPISTSFFGNTVSILMGNGDGTFQSPRTLLKFPEPPLIGALDSLSLVAGDFNGDGIGDLAIDNPNTNQFSVVLGNSAGTAQAVLNYPANGAFSLVAGDFAGNGRLDLAELTDSGITTLLNNGDGTFTSASQLAIAPQANPLVADVNGDGTDDVLVVNGSGEILYRQGVPGQPGTFEPPIIVNPPLPDGTNPYASRDIAWLPSTDEGPVLASIDTQKNAIILYAYRDGGFVRLSGSLDDRSVPGADCRGRPERRRLDRPGRPQCRRRHPVGLLRQPAHQQQNHRSPGLVRSPDVPARGDPDGRSGCLRRPGGRYRGERLARPGRHQRADRPGQRPAQSGQWDVRRPRPVSRRDRVVRDRARHHARGDQPGGDRGRGRRAAHAGRPDRPGDNQPGVEHDGRPGRPGRRPFRQSGRDRNPVPGRKSSAWVTSPATASTTWPSSPPRV